MLGYDQSPRDMLANRGGSGHPLRGLADAEQKEALVRWQRVPLEELDHKLMRGNGV
jgi:hypothetical protein